MESTISAEVFSSRHHVFIWMSVNYRTHKSDLLVIEMGKAIKYLLRVIEVDMFNKMRSGGLLNATKDEYVDD